VRALQADYEDLRNRMEPLSDAIQKLQAEKAELAQQLQQVSRLEGGCDCTSWGTAN
jgi:prefoldin subunit 5